MDWVNYLHYWSLLEYLYLTLFICILRLMLCNVILFLLFPSSIPLFSFCPRLPCCLVCYHSNPYYLPCQLITYTCPSSSLVNLCLYIPLWFSCVLSVIVFCMCFVFWLLSWFLSVVCPQLSVLVFQIKLCLLCISSLYTLQCSYCQSLPVLWCCFCFRPINKCITL